MIRHRSSSSSTEDGQHSGSPSSCPSCGSSSRPLLTSSARMRRSIERWSARPNGRRNPRLRYLDPDDPFDLPDLTQTMEQGHNTVVIAVVVIAALVGLLLAGLGDTVRMDEAIGVARRD